MSRAGLASARTLEHVDGHQLRARRDPVRLHLAFLVRPEVVHVADAEAAKDAASAPSSRLSSVDR